MISRSSIIGAYPTKRLGDIVEFLDSMRRPVTESDRRAGPFPYYGANGQQGTIDDFIFDEPLVLLAEDGGHFETPERGIAYHIAGKTWVNNHAHVLRPKADVDLAYLCRVLENYDVTPFVTGTTRGKLTQAGAANIVVPVPALPEQRRIADVLDRAEALRAKRRAALAQLATLTQSIFLDLFTKGLDGPAVDLSQNREGVPEGWSWEPLTNVARLATGHTPDRARHDYWNGDIPWISLTDIRDLDGTVATRTIQTVTPLGIDNSSSVVLPAGTVCFSRTASVGFVTVMGSEMATSQDFVNWVCGPRLGSMYLMWALLGARRRLQGLSSGSTHKTIYVRVVEQFRVLVPPIALQHEFARRVAAVEKLKTTHRASLVELDALFGSLQHRAFRGQL